MNSCNLLRSIVRKQGFLRTNVVGSSMKPFLYPNDKILLRPTSHLEIGDVVVHPGKRSALPVLHRVVDVGTFSIQTVGDNSFTMTQVSVDDIIAILSALLNESRNMWLNTPPSSLEESVVLASLSHRLVQGDANDAIFSLADNLVLLRKKKAGSLRRRVLGADFGASSINGI